MKRIDKRACRSFLEPVNAPNSDCGLFLIPKLKYIVRTAVKIIGHRRLLVLCFYGRGNIPGCKPELTYTMFQAGDDFITYDHRPNVKNRWRNVMWENLESDYNFYNSGCAFYCRPDELRTVNFCKPYASDADSLDGLGALSKVQHKIRDTETLARQKNRERKIRARMSGLRPLPGDVDRWLQRKVLPAYFFYDYKKSRRSLEGVCSACGQRSELSGVRHNAAGVCPSCGRTFTMKSNGRRGHIWDRATASIVQRLNGSEVIIRIVKAYQSWSREGEYKLDFYEEIRQIVNGETQEAEVYHVSNKTVGITPWKPGYPPVLYLCSECFNRETCGHLYCRNLSQELKGTSWQYCQLEAFYNGVQDQIEVAPYLTAYQKVPAIEFFVKLGLFWLATHVVYRRNGTAGINTKGKNLREVLQIAPSDLSWLQRPKACIRDLILLRVLRSSGGQPSEEFFAWLDDHDLKDADRLERAIHYTTPHKLMRYIEKQFSQLHIPDYRGYAGTLADYDDYLQFCEQLQYDLKNDFVLFPKNLERAHDQAQDLVKQHQVEHLDPQIASMQKELKRLYQFKSGGLVVRPPCSAQEIVREGQKLHHCVGGYAQTMAQNKCVILFIRKEEKKDKPFYTVEVRNNQIIQVRGANNRAPVPEVSDFLESWKKKKHLNEAA